MPKTNRSASWGHANHCSNSALFWVLQCPHLCSPQKCSSWQVECTSKIFANETLLGEREPSLCLSYISTQASPSCTCLAANWCEREWWSHIRNSYWGKNKILGWAACDRGACHTYYRNFKRSQQDFYQLYWKIAPILSPTNLPYEVLFFENTWTNA